MLVFPHPDGSPRLPDRNGSILLVLPQSLSTMGRSRLLKLREIIAVCVSVLCLVKLLAALRPPTELQSEAASNPREALATDEAALRLAQRRPGGARFIGVEGNGAIAILHV